MCYLNFIALFFVCVSTAMDEQHAAPGPSRDHEEHRDPVLVMRDANAVKFLKARGKVVTSENVEAFERLFLYRQHDYPLGLWASTVNSFFNGLRGIKSLTRDWAHPPLIAWASCRDGKGILRISRKVPGISSEEILVEDVPAIFVQFQKEALKWYVCLGFRPQFIDPNFQIIAFPDKPKDKFALVVASTSAERDLVGKQGTLDAPAVDMVTPDFPHDYTLLRNKKVEVAKEFLNALGKREVFIRDQCGNVIKISEQ